MGGIYSGLISNNGYLFITNDTFGMTEGLSAIVRVNKFCGALIITTLGDLLIRVREVLDKSLPRLKGVEDGLSVDLAEAIVESFREEFQKEPSFKHNPLPFLLLLVGYNLKGHSCLEHIFVRNRVIKIMEKNNSREYITAFDTEKPVPAHNLFYGHSALIQYLSQQLPPNVLDLDTVKLLAYFSMTETQKIDISIFQNIRMATISMNDGFKWIREEELKILSDMAKDVDTKLSEELYWLIPG